VVLGLIGLALGQTPELPWYVGLPVAQVQLESGEGLPPDELSPLLQVEQGEVFRPSQVRGDLEVLYRTGAFQAVEVDVEPWFLEAPDGELLPGVRVVYRVEPAPEVRRVRVEGVPWVRRREVASVSGVVPGDRLPRGDEDRRATFRVLRWYADQGWEGTQAHVELVPVGEQVDLVVRVQEGAPAVVETLELRGSQPLGERWTRRQLRRAGVTEGRRTTPDALDAAQRELTGALRDEGFLEARVTLLSDGGETLVVVVAPGPRAVVSAPEEGRLWSGRYEEWLALHREPRLGEAALPDLELRLERALQDEGWPDADASLQLQELGEIQRVVVRVDRGDPVRLARRGVRVQGNTVFEDAVLVQALEQGSPDVLGRRRVNDDALAQGIEEIEALYGSKGYLDAVVTVVEQRQRPGIGRAQVVVELQVDEGPQTQVGTVLLEGARPELAPELLDAAAALERQPYSPQLVRDYLDQVVLAHRNAGYPRADAQVQVALDGDQAHLAVVVDAGPQLYLRSVAVRGTRRVRPTVVLREVDLETGAPITPEALSNTRSQLYGLDSFSSVELSLEGEGDRVRDLLITVDEKPAWEAEAGVGLATDEGLRAFGLATRRQIGGRAHRASLYAQVGVGWRGDTFRLQPTALEWRAGLRYEALNTPGHRQRTYVDLLANERAQEPTFRAGRSGLGVGVELGLWPTARLGAGYRLERRVLEDVDPGALVLGEPWLDDAGQLRAARIDSGVRVSLLDDRRDDPFNPTQGTLWGVEVALTEPALTGFTGVRGLGEVQAWVPLGPLRLRAEAQGGVAWVSGRSRALPVEDRFRLGGAGSLRGFALDSVGPKNLVPDLDLDLPGSLEPMVDYVNRDASGRWVATGGDAMVAGSVELWVPFDLLFAGGGPNTALVFFADAGNVYLIAPGVFATSELVDPEPVLRYSVGAGLRQATPVGPVQLDVGVNPAFSQNAWAQERGESLLRLHVTVGAL
jgi:outer membrane protein insertion porin family